MEVRRSVFKKRGIGKAGPAHPGKTVFSNAINSCIESRPNRMSFRAHQVFQASKSWAGGARRLRAMGQEEAARKGMGYALDYVLRGLKDLLADAFPDEENIADFYKFAAIYAYEMDDAEQAKTLVLEALQRETPPKLRKELLGVLKDIGAKSEERTFHFESDKEPSE